MITGLLREVGSIAIFCATIARTAHRTRGNWDPMMAQLQSICIRSLPTVLFAGVFVGAILVLQFNLMLGKFDAQTFLGGLNTSATVREVGPLIISFLLAGKIGAYTAAELGTMRVTQQIEAIECLGKNPMQYLIVPRFFAIAGSSLILLLIGLLVSIAGSMLVAQTFCGINVLQYASSIPRFTDGWTVFAGALKSLIYGFIVAGVACYEGYNASGGARGVGMAVNRTAVYINLYIIFANFISSELLGAVHTLIFSDGGPS